MNLKQFEESNQVINLWHLELNKATEGLEELLTLEKKYG